MKFIIVLSLLTVSLRLLAGNLVLTVQPPDTPIHVGDYPSFTVTISNRGPSAVTLVQPGDGSDCRWRTPIVGWSVLPVDTSKRQHPAEPQSFKGPRCGNINPIKLSEVFSLAPGESRRLESWVGYPQFDKPGNYRLLFYYQNIPDLRISGLPLGEHERGVIGRLRGSTPCRLVSEEIAVQVLPKVQSTKPAGGSAE